MPRSLKLLIVVAAGLTLAAAVLAAQVFGPPLFSGGLSLLLPGPQTVAAPDPATPYEPVHQGHVNLANGVYIREDEDVVLGKGPVFVWRRTYLSGDHVSRHFGVGATHNAEWYLRGDPQRFQWAEMIRDDGWRVRFERLTPGTSYGNAVYGHTSSATEFYGAMLGWTGLGWALRLRDSTVLSFRGCGPPGTSCSLMAIREASGSTVRFARDRNGLVTEVSTGSERLALEYDAARRVVRASDSSHHRIEYTYDSKGRLERAETDGIVRAYAYGPSDELLNIKEPGREITNRFDANGRLSFQTVRWPGRSDYSEAFAYKVVDDVVVEADERESGGLHTQYRFDEQSRTVLELSERPGAPPTTVQFNRGTGGFVRSMTVMCTKAGRRVSQTVGVGYDEERTKDDAIASLCD